MHAVAERVVRTAAEHGLVLVPRSERPQAWTDIERQLAYCPVAYTSGMLDYQAAYFSGARPAAVDISMILMAADGKPFGIWPLGFEYSDALPLSSSGQPVAAPLMLAATGPRRTATTLRQCLATAESSARDLGMHALTIRDGFAGAADGIGEWQLQSLRQGYVPSVDYELFVDLGLELAAIRANLRSSYKSLVNEGLRNWRLSLLTTRNEAAWAAFRDLHVAVAGRQTRGDASWNVQHDLIAAGSAFLVQIFGEGDKLVGGAYFQCSTHEGLYAVAAYDRSLFDKPLGHVAQIKAIEEMQRRGLRWYRLGQRMFGHERPHPTDKELSISHFKEGFRTHVFPRYDLQHALVESRIEAGACLASDMA